MRNQILSRFGIVVVLAFIAVLFSINPSVFGDTWLGTKLSEYKITLGLDLAGGTELDYRIDLTDAIAQNEDDDPQNDVNLNIIAESVRDALEARVNPAGVGEIVIKRSQVEGEEHILIQMPPSSNVAQAKQDAERDNRLEFFEENPTLLDANQGFLEGLVGRTNAGNWQATVDEWENGEKIHLVEFEDRFRDAVSFPPDVTDKIFAASAGTVLGETFDVRTEPEYTISDSGQIEIQGYPMNLRGMIYVKSNRQESREKTLPAEVEARHILFGYPEAMRAAEDIKYQSKDEAQEEAEAMLARLQEDGTNGFADLAKEYSTEGAAQQSGGSLGTFNPGQMVAAFDEAVFGVEAPGLIEEVIETDFGFHVIEVLDTKEERTETQWEPKVSFAILGWDIDQILWEPTPLGGKQLENTTVGFDEVGNPLVNLLFDAEGGEMFANLTENVANRTCPANPDEVCRLGIKVGGNWITQPTVRQKIVGRTSQISGSFTYESAQTLSDGLNLGAIDAPVILSGQMTIQPELGAEQLEKSLSAALWGFVGIIVFMILIYRMAGVVAGIALILYGGMFMTILKTYSESLGGPIVLTLAGIAGIILSIGLAVDGNILIFERMKEELRAKKSIHQAMELGFKRAWSAIVDSNVTTLIVCFLLFSFGSSIIKGFAITLIFGTMLSMFTAVVVSRNLLRFFLLFPSLQNPKLYGINKK